MSDKFMKFKDSKKKKKKSNIHSMCAYMCNARAAIIENNWLKIIFSKG